MAIIEVKELSKSFENKEAKVEALRNINFNVEEGDIYGIIGMSGAGKSTLVRCLNFLEKPSLGSVTVDGKNLGSLSGKELRELRSSIGMIFQKFNLLMQCSVLENVCYPMTVHGISRTNAKEKALKLLEKVGLSEKASSYPAQLSGGQQQRVAIARALACDPKILLCDEATSALDPQTTQQILDLLRQINIEMGITIVIITHSMTVVREICRNVAIVEDGEIVENGAVEDIFAHPKSKAAKRLFIEEKALNGEETQLEAKKAFNSVSSVNKSIREKKKIRIVFTGASLYEPVISNMIIKFSAPVNILKANIRLMNSETKGEMIIGLIGDEELISKQIAYLEENGLAIEDVSDLEMNF